MQLHRRRRCPQVRPLPLPLPLAPVPTSTPCPYLLTPTPYPLPSPQPYLGKTVEHAKRRVRRPKRKHSGDLVRDSIRLIPFLPYPYPYP